MDEAREFRLPDVGEGLTEAELLSWRVGVGDVVTVNQVVCEVETAKAAVELPSPFAGRVTGLLVEVGTVVPVGTPLLRVEQEARAEQEAAGGEPAAAAAEPVLVGYGVRASAPVRRARIRVSRRRPTPVPVVHPVRSTPPVRKLAKDLEIDLGRVEGTGPGGLVTREDVLTAAGPDPAAVRPSEVHQSAPLPERRDPDRREPMRGIRKAMADAMVRSASEAPHVTAWVQVDVTRTVKLTRRLRETPGFSQARVSPVLLVARASLLALKRHPDLNATYDAGSDEVVYRSGVNLGIAVASPRGLVVPSVKGAESLSLPELAVALDRLVAEAREGRSTPADLTGSTFTITNIGVFGVDGGTPILNPGEAGILCVGAFRKRPWVHKGRVKPRWVAEITLSFDHRIIDGATGSRFLADVAQVLEDPAAAVAWS